MRPFSVSLLASAVAAFVPFASSAHVEKWWNIGWVKTDPAGFSRTAIGVNGRWPPPVVNVKEDDVLKIHAINNLQTGAGTSLHAHGMFFNRTVWSDGAAPITQCPIPPGESFAIEPLNSPHSSPGRQRQWGTYWLHSHNDGQYVDGLRTPLVIHPVRSEDIFHTYDYDYTVILGDWYLRNHSDLIKEYQTCKNPTGAEPVPDAILMYFANTTDTSKTYAPYLPGFNEDATVPMEPGKTYRFRVINMSALSLVYWWLDGHDLRIIEVDGVDTEEYPLNGVLSVSVAQRYSVLVTARNDSSANFLVHANLEPGTYSTIPASLQLNVTSTLSYAKDAPLTPAPVVNAYGHFNDLALVPSIKVPMVPADVSHTLHFSFSTRANGRFYAEFNNTTFVPPQVPSLFTALSLRHKNLSSNSLVYGPASNAIVLKHGDMVEVTIVNNDHAYHPFHLHGHNFQVVHRSLDLTSNNTMLNPPLVEGQANPMRRDSVVSPAGGSVTIRFRADNPGTWFFHCHMEWHLEAGLAAIFIEAPSVVPHLVKPPPRAARHCHMQGIPSTGNAGGYYSTKFFGTLPQEPAPSTNGPTSACSA